MLPYRGNILVISVQILPTFFFVKAQLVILILIVVLSSQNRSANLNEIYTGFKHK